MKNGRAGLVSVVGLAAIALWLWTAQGSPLPTWAQGGGSTQPLTLTTPLLQYQGRLTDVSTGEPVSGTRYISFRLYDSEAAGTPLWVEGGDVSVSGGLFTAILGDTAPLDHAVFNGQALWLEVLVEGEVTGPRQRVVPVPYALSVLPGALVSTTSPAPALNIRNLGTGDALRVDGNLNVSGDLIGGTHSHSGNAITSGTVAEPRIDPLIARDSEVTSAIITHTANASAHHTRYTDFEAWNAILARDGSGSGLDADTVDGLHATTLPQPGKLLALDASGKLPTSITGDALSLGGFTAASYPRKAFDGHLAAPGTFTITVPHFSMWTLQLSSDWGTSGQAFVQGFENDGIAGVVYMEYDGQGVSAATGGADCNLTTTSVLLQFGISPNTYTLRCPGASTDTHQLVIVANGGLPLHYRLVY